MVHVGNRENLCLGNVSEGEEGQGENHELLETEVN